MTRPPQHLRSEVQRILDAEARRLLAEEPDLDTLAASSGIDLQGPDATGAGDAALPEQPDSGPARGREGAA